MDGRQNENRVCILLFDNSYYNLISEVLVKITTNLKGKSTAYFQSWGAAYSFKMYFHLHRKACVENAMKRSRVHYLAKALYAIRQRRYRRPSDEFGHTPCVNLGHIFHVMAY